MGYELQADEIAIIVKPHETGISTGMVIGKGIGDMGEAGNAGVDVALTMAAALMAVQDDAELDDHLQHFKVELVKELFPADYQAVLADIEQEEEENTLVVDGNVLSLNKWTKTEGSA